MKRTLTVTVIVLSLIGGFGSASAQQPTSAPAPVEFFTNGNGNGHGMSPLWTPYGGQPGDYTSIVTDGQMIMGLHEVTGVKAALRGNVARLFKGMLCKDGRGGDAEVAPLPDGKDGFVLIVRATPAMQESIAAVVEKINSTKPGVFNYAPATKVYKPKFRAAESIAAAVRAEKTNVGIVHVDKVLNAVLIDDDPSYVEFLLWVAEQFDQVPLRINAKVTVVEVSSVNDERIGLDWYAWADALPVSMSAGLSADRLPLARERSLGVGVGDKKLDLGAKNGTVSSLQISNFAMAVDGISPQALAGFVNFLSTQGKCKVVTTTDISVVNDAESVVSTEVTVPIPATVSNEVGGKVRTENVAVEGVKLTISGCLFQNGQRLNIEALSSSIVGESRTGLPIMANSRVSTGIGFAVNKTVVISGLTREKEETVLHGPSWDALRLLSKKVKARHQWRLYICIVAEPCNGNGNGAEPVAGK